MRLLSQKTAKLLLVGQLLASVLFHSASYANGSFHIDVDVTPSCQESFKATQKSQGTTQTEAERRLSIRLSATHLLHDIFNNVDVLETYPLKRYPGLEDVVTETKHLKNLVKMFIQNPKKDVPTDLIYEYLDAGNNLSFQGVHVALDSSSGRIMRSRISSASNLLTEAWKICKTNDCRDRYYVLIMTPMISREFTKLIYKENAEIENIASHIRKMLTYEANGGDVTDFVQKYDDAREKLLFKSTDEFKTLIDNELNPAHQMSMKLLAKFNEQRELTYQDLKQVNDYLAELVRLSEARTMAAAISKAKRHAYLLDDFELMRHLTLKFSNFMDEYNRLHLILAHNLQTFKIGTEYNRPHEHIIQVFNDLSEFAALHGVGMEGKIIGQLALPQQQAEVPNTQQLAVVQENRGGANLNVFQKLAQLTRSLLTFNKQKAWDYTPAPLGSKDLKEIFDERALPLENIAAHEFHLDRKDLNETHLFEEQMKLSFTELLLSTHVNLVNESLRTTAQQLADLNQKIIKNKGAAESLISGAVVANVQKDLIEQIKKIDLLNQKYSALAAKKAEFKEQLLREIVQLELKLKTAFGMSKEAGFAEEIKGSGREKYAEELFVRYSHDIEFLNEMKNAFMNHEATYINFNMTIAGAKMAKQTLRFLNEYCQGILSSLIAQNNSNIMGASAEAFKNLKQFAIEKESKFQDLKRQTTFELLTPRR